MLLEDSYKTARQIRRQNRRRVVADQRTRWQSALYQAKGNRGLAKLLSVKGIRFSYKSAYAERKRRLAEWRNTMSKMHVAESSPSVEIPSDLKFQIVAPGRYEVYYLRDWNRYGIGTVIRNEDSPGWTSHSIYDEERVFPTRKAAAAWLAGV